MMLMAISATLIQVAGLIPPYFELAKRNGRVIGIGMQTIVNPSGSTDEHRLLVSAYRLCWSIFLAHGTWWDCVLSITLHR